MLTMAVLRNRLLLLGAGIIPEIIKGDEDALRLVKAAGSGPFGGAPRDGGCPSRRAPRFASPGKGGLYSQVGARHYAPTLGPREPTDTMPWSPTEPPPGTNIPQAAARNARLGLRKSNLALWQGVRLPLTSCGMDKISTA